MNGSLPPHFYYAMKDGLVEDRRKARGILREYNGTAVAGLSLDDGSKRSLPEIEQQRTELLKSLLGTVDAKEPPFIEPPFMCDYGYNIHCGASVYMNFGCVILGMYWKSCIALSANHSPHLQRLNPDCAKVTIGSNVLLGPNVQLFCPGHPLDPKLREGPLGPEFGLPITIGDDVWIGGGAIILPGVTVGNGATVGAGSVVTRDVAPSTVVAGNPARVVRDKVEGEWGLPKKFQGDVAQ
jgi:maltose O-acetyltransferase